MCFGHALNVPLKWKIVLLASYTVNIIFPNPTRREREMDNIDRRLSYLLTLLRCTYGLLCNANIALQYHAIYNKFNILQAVVTTYIRSVYGIHNSMSGTQRPNRSCVAYMLHINQFPHSYTVGCTAWSCFARRCLVCVVGR